MTNQFQIIKNRSLLRIGIAESVSGIGDWITMMAIFALLVFRGGGGVSQSSGVFLCGLVPTLIFSPFAGTLCDRYDRKKLMIFSQITSGIIVAGLIFVNNLYLIYALLALQATSMSIMTPARQSSVPALVKAEELTAANAFLQQLSSLVKIFSPMLAGLILTLVSPHIAIILDVVSFFLSALLLTRLQPLPPALESAAEENKPHFVFSFKQWFGQKFQKTSFSKVLNDTPSLKMLFLAAFFSIFVIVGFDVLAAVFFRDTLKENESFYGLAIGLVGIGALISTVVLMARKRPGHAWQDATLGIALLSTIPLALTFAAVLQNISIARIITLFFCFVGGIGNGLLNVQISTLLQSFTPAPLLGEASGLLQNTMVLGQLAGTILTPILVPALLNTQIFCLVSFLALGALVAVLVVQLMRSPAKFSLPG